MKSMTEREIAADIKIRLLQAIKSTIQSETAAAEYLQKHARICLTNEDKSGEPHWYPVKSKEQVLEIKKSFCSDIPGHEGDETHIIDAVIVGYHIDFSKPTYLAYDLNLLVPILN